MIAGDIRAERGGDRIHMHDAVRAGREWRALENRAARRSPDWCHAPIAE